MSYSDIGVIIGRFETAELHNAHKALLKKVTKNHDRKIVFLGFSPTPANRKYPLSFTIRSAMITDSNCIDNKTSIVPLPDARDNQSWSNQIDELINSYFPNQKAILYGGRDSFIPCYTGKHDVQELNFSLDGDYSATKQREVIGKTLINSYDFRAGIIHAHENNIYQNYETVDIAMEKNGSILMAKKPNEDKWRFPGGFVNLGEKIKSAAARELQEETGMVCSSEASVAYTIIGDYIINDWRIRGVPDKRVRTFLCHCEYFAGKPNAADDVAEVEWQSVDSLNEYSVVPEHLELVSELKTYLNSKKNVR